MNRVRPTVLENTSQLTSGREGTSEEGAAIRIGGDLDFMMWVYHVEQTNALVSTYSLWYLSFGTV